MKAFPIGTLSRATGVKAPTIRYYEGIGLLPDAPRTESNRRLYGAAEVRRLRFIRHARDLGFEIEDIRQLLSLAADPQGPCAEAHGITKAHISAINDKIARLKALRAELQAMVASDEGRIADCRIIEALGDHSRCRNERRRRSERRVTCTSTS
jgi:DNA-binding transcriptional MerR regulator